MMRPRRILFAAFLSLVLLGSVYAFQNPKDSYPKPFRTYPGVEYTNFPLPPDWQEKTE